MHEPLLRRDRSDAYPCVAPTEGAGDTRGVEGRGGHDPPSPECTAPLTGTPWVTGGEGEESWTKSSAQVLGPLYSCAQAVDLLWKHRRPLRVLRTKSVFVMRRTFVHKGLGRKTFSLGLGSHLSSGLSLHGSRSTTPALSHPEKTVVLRRQSVVPTEVLSNLTCSLSFLSFTPVSRGTQFIFRPRSTGGSRPVEEGVSVESGRPTGNVDGSGSVSDSPGPAPLRRVSGYPAPRGHPDHTEVRV